MVLVGIRKGIDKKLLSFALENKPALMINCGNSADFIPPYFPRKKLDDVFVMDVDILYTMKDVLAEVGPVAKSLGIKTIVITTFHKLFNYEDVIENNNVILRLWELMEELGKNFDVLVGVHPNQEVNALRHCG